MPINMAHDLLEALKWETKVPGLGGKLPLGGGSFKLQGLRLLNTLINLSYLSYHKIYVHLLGRLFDTQRGVCACVFFSLGCISRENLVYAVSWS